MARAVRDCFAVDRGASVAAAVTESTGPPRRGRTRGGGPGVLARKRSSRRSGPCMTAVWGWSASAHCSVRGPPRIAVTVAAPGRTTATARCR